MRCIILSVFRCCCARAYEQKRQKMFSSMTCAARRCETFGRPRSRRRLRKIAVDANTARYMRRLYNGGKHSEREWLTHRTVRGRDEMNVVDDDKNFIVYSNLVAHRDRGPTISYLQYCMHTALSTDRITSTCKP